MTQNQQQIKDILTHYQGLTNRLKTLFAYHYDQIDREIHQELSHIDKEDQGAISEWLALYLEEYMNWPSNQSDQEFIQDLISD
jgi:hypothetical protein